MLCVQVNGKSLSLKQFLEEPTLSLVSVFDFQLCFHKSRGGKRLIQMSLVLSVTPLISVAYLPPQASSIDHFVAAWH